jgi:3-hydroxymyristoyl/3-hydroxydecanoyl-(acyl carrier protein) dehydratase
MADSLALEFAEGSVTVSREGAEGACDVGRDLVIFETHFPLFPVVPGLLVVDLMLDLAARVVSARGEGSGRLVSVTGVRFLGFVRPGQRVACAVELVATDGDVALRGVARVGERVVVRVRDMRFRSRPG